ncbi:MAG: aminoacetone oxidase family FAD-binding enzyme [Anaerolineae bacterium]|nr:MAG: aminoacetone oxidase family FAD-binding enzyme [Anaerolineae bacterium]
MNSSLAPRIAVVGGGPAGLMAAERLALARLHVHLYEAMPSVGRKFLRAGVGGLNLTHSEPLEQFISRYNRPERLGPMLRAFGPRQLVEWVNTLGFETFIGTSGRVFPVGMKASPILRAWLKRLGEAGVVFQTGYTWQDISYSEQDQALRLFFRTPAGETSVQAQAVLLALGGGSWPRLGSTGQWVKILEARGIPIAPLEPANCGFDVAWSPFFREKFHGTPLKAVKASFGGITRQGEFIITRQGVEGSLIYTFSSALREAIKKEEQATLWLDLAPDWTHEKLVQRLKRPRGSRSIGNHLEKTIGLRGVKSALLHEFLPREQFEVAEQLAAAIKALPLPLLRPAPLEKAISSAGGVCFEAMNEHLMLKALPGVFCAGEMLDWEAPTGGYLLTGCFSTAVWAAKGILAWLEANYRS